MFYIFCAESTKPKLSSFYKKILKNSIKTYDDETVWTVSNRDSWSDQHDAALLMDFIVQLIPLKPFKRYPGTLPLITSYELWGWRTARNQFVINSKWSQTRQQIWIILVHTTLKSRNCLLHFYLTCVQEFYCIFVYIFGS